jgi:hypothetical protein
VGGCVHNLNSPDNPCQIASVWPVAESNMPREERDANAKLIAASPKLLEVARLVAILCDDFSDGAPDSPPFALECNRLGEIIDAAIADATD